MKFLILLICFFLVSFCRTGQKTDIQDEKGYRVVNDTALIKEPVKKSSVKSIKDLYQDTGEITFTDEGSFWLLYFNKQEVVFEFNPSCGYSFPTTLVDDKIIFFWAKKMNCNFGRGLSQSFKGIKSPEIGKEFGEIYLVNDSIIHIDYYYKEWVKKINEVESKSIDSLFPSKLKIVEL